MFQHDGETHIRALRLSMLDQHRLIDDLEAEIDQLREAAERCRKLDLAAKAG